MFYKHWKKISLALTAFFWASCNNATTTEPPMYGVPPDISSSSTTPESSSAVTPDSSSAEPISKNSIDSAQILCYNESIQSNESRAVEIIECSDGNKYLRDPTIYRLFPNLFSKIPEDVKTEFPTPGSAKASNCRNETICHDIPIKDEQGNTRNAGGCNPTIQCPNKPKAEDTTAYNCYSTSITNKDGIDIGIIECEDGKKWTKEKAPFSICAKEKIDIPEGINYGFPNPSEKYAKNCKIGPDTCIISECTNEEYCAPTIDCPPK